MFHYFFKYANYNKWMNNWLICALLKQLHPVIKYVVKLKLDWANSAPTYPQTGHHSRHRFWSGIFKNIITHYYMNFSTSIYSVYIFQGRWCIPRRRIHNSNYIFNLPAMITLNLFSKYLNDWWLNVHSKIIIPKEHICFYICWQIKYYF